MERRRRDRERAIEQVLAHDYQRQSRGADVLLRAAIDHAVTRHIDRTRQKVRRHVCHQRHCTDVRYPVILDAADRLVGAHVHVRGVGRQLPARAFRHIGEVFVFARRRDVDLRVLLRFLDRLLRPFAGVDEVDHFAIAEQVHRHDRVFADRAALQEQHFVVVTDRHQLAQIGLGLVRDRNELGAAMAHLHHRHAAAVPVEHFCCGALQHFFREHRGSGAEIEDGHLIVGFVKTRWAC